MFGKVVIMFISNVIQFLKLFIQHHLREYSSNIQVPLFWHQALKSSRCITRIRLFINWTSLRSSVLQQMECEVWQRVFMCTLLYQCDLKSVTEISWIVRSRCCFYALSWAVQELKHWTTRGSHNISFAFISDTHTHTRFISASSSSNQRAVCSTQPDKWHKGVSLLCAAFRCCRDGWKILFTCCWTLEDANAISDTETGSGECDWTCQTVAGIWSVWVHFCLKAPISF